MRVRLEEDQRVRSERTAKGDLLSVVLDDTGRYKYRYEWLQMTRTNPYEWRLDKETSGVRCVPDRMYIMTV